MKHLLIVSLLSSQFTGATALAQPAHIIPMNVSSMGSLVHVAGFGGTQITLALDPAGHASSASGTAKNGKHYQVQFAPWPKHDELTLVGDDLPETTIKQPANGRSITFIQGSTRIQFQISQKYAPPVGGVAPAVIQLVVNGQKIGPSKEFGYTGDIGRFIATSVGQYMPTLPDAMIYFQILMQKYAEDIQYSSGFSPSHGIIDRSAKGWRAAFWGGAGAACAGAGFAVAPAMSTPWSAAAAAFVIGVCALGGAAASYFGEGLTDSAHGGGTDSNPVSGQTSDTPSADKKPEVKSNSSNPDG